MKFSQDEIHNYLKQWGDNETVSAYAIAWERGYTDICIKDMQCSGALCNSVPIEKQILAIKISDKKYRKQCGECFKDCIIYTNPQSNETWWVPTNDDLNYFVSEEEIFKLGYTNKEYFNKPITLAEIEYYNLMENYNE